MSVPKKSRSLREERKNLQLEHAIDYFRRHKSAFELMVKIVDRNPGSLSLRGLEFFCAKMAKDKSILVTDPKGNSVPVFKEYENCMETHKKRSFDCFRRKGKNKKELVTVILHGIEHQTTLAQLTFFRLMHQRGILKAAIARSDEIAMEMSKGSK